MSTLKTTNIAHPSSASNNIVLASDGTVLAPSLVPPGTVQFYAANSAPQGWLKANGADISRTTYADLFAAIGTTFGSGDGSTTFTLPDMRGEFPRGWDDSKGVDTARVFGTSQGQDTQAHAHKLRAARGLGSISNGATYLVTSGSSLLSYSTNFYTLGDSTAGGGTYGSSPNLVDAASDQIIGDETRPRNIALLVIIKF